MFAKFLQLRATFRVNAMRFVYMYMWKVVCADFVKKLHFNIDKRRADKNCVTQYYISSNDQSQKEYKVDDHEVQHGAAKNAAPNAKKINEKKTF